MLSTTDPMQGTGAGGGGGGRGLGPLGTEHVVLKVQDEGLQQGRCVELRQSLSICWAQLVGLKLLRGGWTVLVNSYPARENEPSTAGASDPASNQTRRQASNTRRRKPQASLWTKTCDAPIPAPCPQSLPFNVMHGNELLGSIFFLGGGTQ